MSTASEREAALRRALLSAAEQIELAPGGLERIQARLKRPRPAVVAWLESAWTVVMMRAPDVIEAVRRRAAEMLRLVWDRFGPKSVPGGGRQRLSWLRPLAAMSVAVFVIGAGVYVGLATPAAIFQTGGFGLGPTGGQTGSHPGGRATSGAGTPDGKGSRSAYAGSPSPSGSSPACKKNLPQFKSGAPSQSSSSQPSSPATSPSGSTSPSPSPSPSDSASPSPGSSTPSSGQSAAAPAALASGNPASAGEAAVTGTKASNSTTHSARGGALSANASAATASKSLTSSPSQQSPCNTGRSKGRHHKTTSSPSPAALTSAQLTWTQPGRAVAAKLD